MSTVSFSKMSEGSGADYRMLAEYERDQINALPENILSQLRNLETGLQGYKILVTRFTSFQDFTFRGIVKSVFAV